MVSSDLDCVGNISYLDKWCRADEEPVDQKKYLEDICKPICAKPMHDYGVKHFLLSFHFSC